MLFDSKHRLPATKLPHVGEPQDVRYCSLNPYQHCLYPSLHTYFISFLYLFPFSGIFFPFLSFSLAVPASIFFPLPLPLLAACRHHLNWMQLV